MPEVAQLADKRGVAIQAIHVPKTVDNDLADHGLLPGFGSVAKYVAVSIREAGFDVASMAKTSTKVFIMEVMGRHAGWIAARRSRRGKSRRCAAHHPVPRDQVRRREILRARQGVRREVRLLRGRRFRRREERRRQVPLRRGLRDAFGHAQLGGVAPVIAQLVKAKLNYKYHWAVADYLQRAARHIASKVDVEQAYAVGKAAVELALKDRTR